LSDIALFINNNVFDLSIENGDLAADDGLETAVAISLFTDKRVTDEELPTLETNKRGWWGDIFSDVDQDQIGSRLWTISREKRVTETLRRSEDLAREALQWMLEDDIADSISVVSEYDSNNFLIINVDIKRPNEDEVTRYSVLWDQQEIRRAA